MEETPHHLVPYHPIVTRSTPMGQALGRKFWISKSHLLNQPSKEDLMQSKFASKTQVETSEQPTHSPVELQLARETLQNLQPGELQAVRGGTSLFPKEDIG